MSNKLTRGLSSKYFEAASKLSRSGAKRKVVAYVESYDDVLFWSMLLRDLETDKVAFEVMLPSRTSLGKGKKKVLMNELGDRLGTCMIACVDADYDYLMGSTTPLSYFVNANPYVFHTYAYAIDNFRCFAPTLRTVCTMATLNDRVFFDFETFLTDYSRIIFPLFVWNVWCYRHSQHKHFDLAAFAETVALEHFSIAQPAQALEALRTKVNRKISWLQRQFPQAHTDYKALTEQLQDMGVSPELTYLFMRGHDLHDNVVSPLLSAVSDRLRREREKEIRRLAVHDTQMQNELAAYRRYSQDVEQTLRQHTGYRHSSLYVRIQQDISTLIDKMINAPEPMPEALAPPEPTPYEPAAKKKAAGKKNGNNTYYNRQH